MAADIESIKEACNEQSDWSMQIFGSIDNVRESTQSNLDSARIMEKGVDNLLAQINVLKNEIKQLQISERRSDS
jgi:methyl-accepting chemotaxis protein